MFLTTSAENIKQDDVIGRATACMEWRHRFRQKNAELTEKFSKFKNAELTEKFWKFKNTELTKFLTHFDDVIEKWNEKKKGAWPKCVFSLIFLLLI